MTELNYICQDCGKKVDPEITPVCPFCNNLVPRTNNPMLFIGVAIEDSMDLDPE